MEKKLFWAGLGVELIGVGFPQIWQGMPIWLSYALVTLGGFLIVAAADGYLREKSKKAQPDKSTKEQPADQTGTPFSYMTINEIRSDALWLKNTLYRWRPYSKSKEQIIELYDRLQNSNHQVWNEQNLDQLREDFLDRCSQAVIDEPHKPPVKEKLKIRGEVKRAWKRIDEALKERQK